MYTKAVATAVMAISLAAGSLAYAQGQGYGNDRGRNDNYRRGDYARQNERGPDQYRGHTNNEWRGHEWRGHEWRRGERLPAEFRHRQYFVNDWRGHHLSAPPRGHRWVQHGNDYVLVAVASGVIAQLLLNHQ
jgi:Ni/Co efflux regulator RcnB